MQQVEQTAEPSLVQEAWEAPELVVANVTTSTLAAAEVR